MNTNSNGKRKVDVYEAVTREILRNMTRGELPWRKTWTARRGRRQPIVNHFTGKPYSLLNSLLIGEPGEYGTYNQITAAGGSVKGLKGKLVVRCGDYIPKEKKEEAERLEAEGKSTAHLKKTFLKHFYVFNVKDAGLPVAEDEPENVMEEAVNPTNLANLVVGDYTVNESLDVEEDDTLDPAYIVADDTVTMPTRQAFTYEEDYYASLFEQFVHSTATEERCSRKAELKSMGEGTVSVREELTAEIGASMILTVVGLRRHETHEQISAACQKWIREMNNDYRLIVNAASGAEKAAKLILGDYAA